MSESNHQTLLVLWFIDYEQVYDSADWTTLMKVLSLGGIPDKYTKVKNVMYEYNIAAGELL